MFHKSHVVVAGSWLEGGAACASCGRNDRNGLLAHRCPNLQTLSALYGRVVTDCFTNLPIKEACRLTGIKHQPYSHVFTRVSW